MLKLQKTRRCLPSDPWKEIKTRIETLQIEPYSYKASFGKKDRSFEGIIEITPYAKLSKESPYIYWICIKSVFVYNGVSFNVEFGRDGGYVGEEPLAEKLAMAGINISEEEFMYQFIRISPVLSADYRIKNKELFIDRIEKHLINKGQNFIVNTIRQLLDAGLEVDILTFDYIIHFQTRSLLKPQTTEENGGDISFLLNSEDGKINFLSSPMTKCFDTLGYREIDIINMKSDVASLSGKKSEILNIRWIGDPGKHPSYNIHNRRSLYESDRRFY